MHYVSIAVNAHDSGITLANETDVILHLELERFFNIKHYCIDDVDLLFAVLSLLFQDYAIFGKITFILSQHKRQVRLTAQIIDYIHREYPKSDIYEVEHLDAHAALCYLSNLDDALVVAMDGGGDRRVALEEPNFLVYLYKQGCLKLLDLNSSPRFDGRVWSLVSRKLFNDRFGAGKTMGLAAYGEFSQKYQDVLLGKEFTHLGNIWDRTKWNHLFSQLETKDFQDSACLAYTLQTLFSKNIIATLKQYRHYSENIVLTGGCALNVITNNLIGNRLNYRNVYVPPCPSDEGQSLGALLYFCGEQGVRLKVHNLPYLGQGDEKNDLSESGFEKLVAALVQQKTVAWHMGKAEIGPRALGHRSLLAMPTGNSMKSRISEMIKKREPFRPVAPMVLEEYASDWFDFKFFSPYMSFAVKAKEKTQQLAPAIVHADGTSRVQTLSRNSNPILHELISRIYAITGIPILINTSLNIAGLPICNIEQHSKDFYVSTSVDVLNLNGAIYSKDRIAFSSGLWQN